MIYSQYDDIASRYDALFGDEKSLTENREVGEMLPPLVGSVLDVGCGTGLLTEIVNVLPDNYLGIDPSKGMLKQFVEKHPTYRTRVINEPFNKDKFSITRYDNVISLFGSPSYLSYYDIETISTSKARIFLMFYKEDYHPVTYEKCNVEFKHNVYSRELLEKLFDVKIKNYHNYYIVNKV